MNPDRLRAAKRRHAKRSTKPYPKQNGGPGLLLLFLVFVLAVMAINSAEQEQKKVKPEMLTREIMPDELREDLSFLVETLEDVHPNLYAHVTVSEIAMERNRIERELTLPMTRAQFYSKVAPLVARFRDGHTGAVPPAEEFEAYMDEGAMLFPLLLDFREDKVTIRYNFSNDTLLAAGTEVTAVNGVSVMEMQHTLLSYISGDHAGFQRMVLGQQFHALQWLVYQMESPYEVTIRRNNGRSDEVTRTLLGVTRDKMQAEAPSGTVNTQEAAYAYARSNRMESVGVLDFNSFCDEETFGSFLDTTFAAIAADSIQDLIIDLRSNGGGNSGLGDMLLAYLTDQPFNQVSRMDVKVSKQSKKHFASWLPWYQRVLPASVNDFYKKLWKTEVGQIATFMATPDSVAALSNRFGGDVYLLIDNGTFSSATMFTATIKDYKLGTILGQETGGLATHYGEVYSFRLPNTSLQFYCSTKRFLRPSGEDNGHGVTPDVEVFQTERDTRRGRDTVIEEVYKLIAERQRERL